MVKQLTVLIALAIGASMVLSTLSAAAKVIPMLMKQELLVTGLVVPLIPLLVSVLFAYLIYRFATRIKIDEQAEMGNALLLSGSKLFGMYLLVQGLSILLGIPFLLTKDNPESSITTAALLICTLYLGLGYLLIKRTSWLASVISEEN